MWFFSFFERDAEEITERFQCFFCLLFQVLVRDEVDGFYGE